jgi:uncharacterized membrane protein
MFDGLTFWVDKPGWLWLLVLIIPTFLLGRRSLGGLSRTKMWVTFIFRCLVLGMLAIALAEPNWARRGEGLTAMILLDRSDSIPVGLKQQSVAYLQQATKERSGPEDRLGVIEVGKDAAITAMPDVLSAVGTPSDQVDATGTNLAGAVNLAMALLPDDTANRLILVSDGNETEGSVMEAAEVARANGVPIDVLMLEYEHDSEVVFERLIAPAQARFGQTINVKMVLRAPGAMAGPVSGHVTLSMRGEVLDLNGEAPGASLPVTIEAGPAKVIPVSITLDQPGPHRFDARFEPDEAARDRIPQNNNAVAVTFVGAEGRVLVIDDGQGSAEHLVDAMTRSEIIVDRVRPEGTGGLIEMSAYDAVVLANVPRWSFDDEQDRTLHAYVHELGGGLVMLGGPQSLGAGGWIDSETSKTLPVKLDPPSMQQMPRGALVIIMHSCEMPQGNFWGEQVAIAAVEALSSEDYIGIIDFDWGAGGAAWAFPLTRALDKSAPIAAAKKMKNGDMPDFASSMQMALTGLQNTRAGKKHVIIITDGDPSPPSRALLNQFVSSNISVSTVMVAGHGSPADNANLQNIATMTGGTAYNVTNPKNLPQIFIKEAQLVSRSLIVEGDVYQPGVVSRLPGPVESFSAVPAIDGYVLTAPRDGLSQIPVVAANILDGMPVNDPIFAHWNYGVGKSIVFTSDLTGRWGSRWVAWDEFRAFWEKSMRWVMRPSSPLNFTIDTRQEGDTAFVELEALEGDASFLNYLRTNAVVLGPDGEPRPLPLQQVGPGKYRGEFRTDEAGAYLVNVNYAGGASEAATRGSVQAAVAVPYSSEFRAVKHNAALLKRLAEATDGRVLTMGGDPLAADLFDRQSLEVPQSPKRVWDLLAIIAAAIFLFDVAARRVSIDPQAIAALLGRAVGKRAETGEDTMAAWKKARAQVAHRREGAASSENADARAKFTADAASAATAIDVAAEGPGRKTEAAKPARDREAATPRGEPAEDYTSRLLRAKRRAKGQDEGGDGAAHG